MSKPTSLRLFNTLTKTKEVFAPLDPKNVRMYVCGPTVYDLAHIGNARPVVVYDVLTRLLRRLYPHVTYVRNITDVDDKINARARETGEPIGAITARTTAQIAEMILIIQRLIASGHAYAAQGHVLFAVASDPGYGQLSGRSQDE